MPKNPYLSIHGGRYFVYGDGESYLELLEVATHLSKINRFAGATNVPYSVAQHSMVVADILLDWKLGPHTALHGLLHDAHESVTSDIPTPFQVRVAQLAGFDVIEMAKKELDDAIMPAFGIAWPPKAAVAKAVKHADRIALIGEVLSPMLFPTRPPWIEDYAKYHEISLEQVGRFVVTDVYGHERARDAFQAYGWQLITEAGNVAAA